MKGYFKIYLKTRIGINYAKNRCFNIDKIGLGLTIINEEKLDKSFTQYIFLSDSIDILEQENYCDVIKSFFLFGAVVNHITYDDLTVDFIEDINTLSLKGRAAASANFTGEVIFKTSHFMDVNNGFNDFTKKNSLSFEFYRRSAVENKKELKFIFLILFFESFVGRSPKVQDKLKEYFPDEIITIINHFNSNLIEINYADFYKHMYKLRNKFLHGVISFDDFYRVDKENYLDIKIEENFNSLLSIAQLYLKRIYFKSF